MNNGQERKTCDDCFYMESDDHGQKWCNRYPPTAIGIPVPQRVPVIAGVQKGGIAVQLQKMSFSPPVKADRPACGEFKPKVGK